MARSPVTTPRRLRQSSEPLGESRAEKVFRFLHTAIQAGKFTNGERIREEEIATLLGVSRTPVREALSRLLGRGLLEIAPGGLIVAQLTRTHVLELYAMREVLEGAAARFAAQHAAASEIITLHLVSEEFAANKRNPTKLAAINRAFHDAICDAAHNRYFRRMLDEFHDKQTLLPATTQNLSDRHLAAVQEHEKIVKAIERRDADAAEQAAREHVQKVQQALLQVLFKF